MMMHKAITPMLKSYYGPTPVQIRSDSGRGSGAIVSDNRLKTTPFMIHDWYRATAKSRFESGQRAGTKTSPLDFILG